MFDAAYFLHAKQIWCANENIFPLSLENAVDKLTTR